MNEIRYKYALMLANHWSFTGIGWQLGIESCRDSIEDSLNLADKEPHVKVCINLDARAYATVKKYYPETTDRLSAYLKEGKADIIGGTYGQPMGSMMGNESVIRQIVEGRRVIKESLDYDMPSFLEEEEFTFPQLPQILLKSGFSYASLAQCDTWGKVGAPVMEYSRILWEGKDGSKIPAIPRTKLYFHPPSVTKDVNELLSDTGRENLRACLEKCDYPIVTAWTEFGWEPADEHNINMFYNENYEQLKAHDDVAFVTMTEYMQKHAKSSDPSVYVAYDDFNKLLPWGVGADQIRRYDRIAEAKLLFAERLDAIAYARGLGSEKEKLREGWESLMVSQSHDVSLCEYSRWGGGVIPAEEHAMNFYGLQWGAIGYYYLDNAIKIADATTQKLYEKFFQGQAKKPPFACIKGLTTINLTEKPKCGEVKTERVYFPEGIRSFVVKDLDGNQIPSQILEEKRRADGSLYYAKLVIFADSIPAMGCKTYYVCEGEQAAEKSKLLTDDGECYVFENTHLTAKVDKNSGFLIALVCKQTGENTLKGNTLMFHGQPSHKYPHWARDVKLPYFSSAEHRANVKVEKNGERLAKVVSEFKTDQYTLKISYELTASNKGLDVRCRLKINVPPSEAEGAINGWQLPLEILDGYWLDFYTDIEDPEYLVDAPFEIVQTKKDVFHATHFVDIVGERTCLMIAHGGNQYFKKTEGGLSNLLLREWESHFSHEVDWQHYTEYDYTLFPHEKTNNAELLLLSRTRDEKPLVFENSSLGESIFEGIENFRLTGAVLSSLRIVDGGWEVRVFNPTSEKTAFSLTAELGFSQVEKTDMLCNRLGEIALEGKTFQDELSPWEIATYLLK